MLNTRITVRTSWLRKILARWSRKSLDNKLKKKKKIWIVAPVLDKNRVGFVENWKIISVFEQEK